MIKFLHFISQFKSQKKHQILVFLADNNGCRARLVELCYLTPARKT